MSSRADRKRARRAADAARRLAPPRREWRFIIDDVDGPSVRSPAEQAAIREWYDGVLRGVLGGTRSPEPKTEPEEALTRLP